MSNLDRISAGRKSGWYWVKFTKDSWWWIARWSEPEGTWIVPGGDHSLVDKELYKIGPYIEPPNGEKAI